MSRITSVHNPRIKQAARLRERKGRHEQGRIIIDGAREIERAVAGGILIEEVYVCPELCSDGRARAVAAKASTEQIEVTPAVFGKLAFGERAEGIVAIAHAPQRKLCEAKTADDLLLGVLVAVEKPGNMGAVIRSADGAGVQAIIIADGGTDLYNPNVIRASLGVVFTLPVYEATSEETLAWLRERGFQMVAARVDGPLAYTSIDYRRATAIVLGSEARGLSPVWRAADVTAVNVPMLGAADSLNVSCTAAILFYEALRQRSAKANREG